MPTEFTVQSLYRPICIQFYPGRKAFDHVTRLKKNLEIEAFRSFIIFIKSGSKQLGSGGRISHPRSSSGCAGYQLSPTASSGHSISTKFCLVAGAGFATFKRLRRVSGLAFFVAKNEPELGVILSYRHNSYW